MRAVARAWKVYARHPDVGAGVVVKQVSIHRSTEFVFSVGGNAPWSEVLFLECLHEQGAVATAMAVPDTMSALLVTVVVSAVGRVDLVRVARESVAQVRGSPLYKLLVMLLALLLVWWALHLSSFSHPPWTLAPLRWAVEAWRGSSSS